VERPIFVSSRPGKIILGLVSTVDLAARIAKTAKDLGLTVHNSDRSEVLLRWAREQSPLFVILDWDGCEAEAFKVLKEFGSDADLKRVPCVGCLSRAKTDLKREAQSAGCDRVYFKTEFFQELKDLFIRYAR
jgi:DNA-binding response OmpR family regulator